MFKEASNRLLREKWQDKIQALSEELYAIFQQEILTTQGQTNYEQKDADASSITIKQPGYSNAPAITITRRGSDGNPDPLQTVTIGNGDVTIGGESVTKGFDDNADADKALGDRVKALEQAGGGGGGFPGRVLSGTGATYSVEITTAAGLQTVTVTQLQIDPAETIPANTRCLVAKVGTLYYMQVPVWL